MVSITNWVLLVLAGVARSVEESPATTVSQMDVTIAYNKEVAMNPAFWCSECLSSAKRNPCAARWVAITYSKEELYLCDEHAARRVASGTVLSLFPVEAKKGIQRG